MENLIEALLILLKYNNSKTPLQSNWEYIGVIVDKEVSEVDKAKLLELGFHYAPDKESYISYKYEYK